MILEMGPGPGGGKGGTQGGKMYREEFRLIFCIPCFIVEQVLPGDILGAHSSVLRFSFLLV